MALGLGCYGASRSLNKVNNQSQQRKSIKLLGLLDFHQRALGYLYLACLVWCFQVRGTLVVWHKTHKPALLCGLVDQTRGLNQWHLWTSCCCSPARGSRVSRAPLCFYLFSRFFSSPFRFNFLFFLSSLFSSLFLRLHVISTQRER